MSRFISRLVAISLGLLQALPAAAQGIAGADPTAPIGLGIGRFTLYPAVEIGGTFTRGTIGAPGWAATLSPELRIVLEGGVHEVALTLGAEVIPVATSASVIVAAAAARLDVGLNLPGPWQVDFTAFYGLAERDPLDPLLPPGLDETPRVRNSGAQATLEGPVGPLALRLSIGVERAVFEDAVAGGVVVDQGDRDHTAIEGTVRVATDGGGRLTPFVEATVGRDMFDRPVGTDGFLQAGNFAEARVGIAYNSAPVLTAEFAIGYHWEFPDDPTLMRLAGFTFGASTQWSPREVLLFTLSSLTRFSPDPSPTSAGSVRQEFAFRGTIDARDNFVVGLTGEYAREWFDAGAVEDFALAGADFAWDVSRWLQITAGVSHQWLSSTDPLRNGQSSTIAVTARLQR